MEGDIGLLLLFQVILIVLNAIFASAEIAVLSISETKLERMAVQGNRRAGRLYKLTREPAKFLAAIQVAITLSGFLGSAFAADNFAEPLVNAILSLGVKIPHNTLNAAAVVFITLILSYVTLIFGELVPKRIAMKRPEQLALGISGLVSAIAVLFKPIVWMLSISTNAVLRLFGIDPNEAEDQVNEEEIRMMVDAGSEKGTIDHEEKELIQNVFEFNDISVGDIATHRTEVTILWLEDEPDVWAETIFDSRHNLYPVCDDSPDSVIGILNAKDYFRLEDKSKANILASAVREAYFVPETIKADVLFRNMRNTRNSMAVVLDEYGGMVGIVTIFDLIEELVGEISEETDDEKTAAPRIEKIDEVTWSISGNAELRDISNATGLELTSEEFDTFTGMVFDALGTIPPDGDTSIKLEHGGMLIEVKSIAEHQIVSATVTILPREKTTYDENISSTRSSISPLPSDSESQRGR